MGGKKYTVNEFIMNAKEVHGDKYDYSKVIYTKSKNKIIIICKEHGEFEITSTNHIHRYRGCQKCNKFICRTYDDFIKKSIEKFGTKFEYNEDSFISMSDKITIICPIHNKFEIIAGYHIKSKTGCSKCGLINTANARRSNQDEFINRSKKLFNDKYDYSKVIYKLSQENIILTCKEHGDFKVTPNAHLNNNINGGCKLCANKLLSDSKKIPYDIFLLKANEKHENKFVYIKNSYKSMTSCIQIICPIHGLFVQKAGDHITRIHACSKCYQDNKRGKGTITKEEFIKKCIIKHGNKYDYSDVVFKGVNHKIIIKCPTHGSFLQQATSHLTAGSGCRYCVPFNHSKISLEWLNYMKIRDTCNIQHSNNIKNNGEHRILNSYYSADGYCKETNTIYEFNGSFWHGDPRIYKLTEINKRINKTYGELYENTLKKRKHCEDNGYKIVECWEYDWKTFKKCIIKIQRQFRNNKRRH